jgi:hypothetical protein
MCGQEQVDTDIGESSISSCFFSAMSAMPEDVRLIEVRYLSLHMGTYERQELTYLAQATAKKIVDAHRELLDAVQEFRGGEKGDV